MLNVPGIVQAVMVCALLTTPVPCEAQRTNRPRPNIVVILADDLDAILGTLDYIPNINKLVRDDGINFKNALVTNSVCCPSRSTLLRGQYTHSHQVYTNRPPTGGYQKFVALGRDSSTIATWLSKAGYATSLLGKYLNGYPDGAKLDVPPGWSDWHVEIGNGYANKNYQLNENGAARKYGSAPADYMTDVLKERAVEFMRRSMASRTPFYLEVATFAPHAPSTPALRHDTLFAGLKVPRTPPYSEANAWIAEGMDWNYRKRIQSMQAVDEMVAELIKTLKDSGQLAHTYFFFTSDNGFHLGQHGLRSGKQTAYEEDIRVPLFVRGPGIKAGSTSDALVANVDLAPTFAELAGVVPPDFVEGRSLVPLFGRPKPTKWRAAVLVESYFGNTADNDSVPAGASVSMSIQQPLYVALRTARHTYIEYRDGKRLLFDLERDPSQLKNIADADSVLTKSLSAWARAMTRCSGAQCRTVESNMKARTRN